MHAARSRTCGRELRFVDDDVRKEWATLGKSYTDLKHKVDDHMARQRLNAGLALRCLHRV